MSKLKDYREKTEILTKRLSKCFMKRETNAIINADKELAETLATEIREIVDEILKSQEALPTVIEDPTMMTDVIELLIGKKRSDNVKVQPEGLT